MPRRTLRLVLLVALAAGAGSLASCTSTSKKTPATPTPVAVVCGGNGIICTVAGTAGLFGPEGDEGLATQARLNVPRDVFVDADGSVIIDDWNNHRYRRVDAAGTIHAFIATGFPGSTCTGAASQLQLNHPVDFRVGPDNNFYFAGWHTDDIIRVDRATLSASCVGACGACGTISRGCAGYPGPADACVMNIPSSIVWDAAGNMYVADQGCQVVLKIDTQPTPQVSVFCGTMATQGFADGCTTTAKFNMDKGPNAQPDGRMDTNAARTVAYLADSLNHRIRAIDLTTGCVTTIAGTGVSGFAGDGGPAVNAQFNFPLDVAVDAAGNLYVADSWNQRVRKIAANGTVTTVAGNGTAGYSPDGTAAASASLNLPSGVFISGDNTLFIADASNHLIRKVKNP